MYPVLGAYTSRIVSSSCCIDPFTIMSSFDLCCFKIHSIRGENCNLCYLFIYVFLLSIWLANLSPSLCFESLCILACKMGLDATYQWVLAVSFDWGILVNLNLGLLTFDVSRLFCPLVDVKSSLC